jgi:gluconate 5-dehydrogenase
MASQLFDLSGRTALVTGSTRGIGLALARGLGRAGARVVVHGRDAGRARDVADSLRGQGIAATSHAFDLADADTIVAGIEAVEDESGGIDILVNNAGFIERGPLTEFDLATWRAMFDVNVTSAMLAARALAPAMIGRGGGKIINISSVLSVVARPNVAAYATTKAALRMLTQAMCAEWAPHGIQANAIAPGYVKTELNTALSDSAEFDTWLTARTPAGRWGRPEDLEGAVVFLAGSGSDFVNGHVLHVDGGLLAVI